MMSLSFLSLSLSVDTLLFNAGLLIDWCGNEATFIVLAAATCTVFSVRPFSILFFFPSTFHLMRMAAVAWGSYLVEWKETAASRIERGRSSVANFSSNQTETSGNAKALESRRGRTGFWSLSSPTDLRSTTNFICFRSLACLRDSLRPSYLFPMLRKSMRTKSPGKQ